jgi:hypothetical protein
VALNFLLPGIVLTVLLLRAYTDVDDAFVEVWAKAHALQLTAANRSMVRWYLHTARVLRTWGAIGGLVLPPLIGAAFGSQTAEDMLFFLVFLGYLAGAAYAEVALVRPVEGERRQAVLVPRDVADYLPRRLFRAPRWVTAVTVIAGTAAVLVSYDRDAASGMSGSPRSSAAVMVVLALLVTVALERCERWLVERPQPFTSPDLVAADDAIRSQSLHSVAGSGLAILLLCLGGSLLALSRSDVQFLRWTAWAPGAACLLGSLQACLYYGHRAWRVRRAVPPPVAA